MEKMISRMSDCMSMMERRISGEELGVIGLTESDAEGVVDVLDAPDHREYMPVSAVPEIVSEWLEWSGTNLRE